MNENVNRNVVRNAHRSNSNASRSSGLDRTQYSPQQLRVLQGSQIAAAALVKHLTGKSGGRLVMLIGLPASGKSTISEAFEAAGWLRLNKDSLRKELYGDESILGDSRAVIRLFYSRLEEGMKAGRNILVDNTNVASLHRKGPLAMAAEHDYPRATHIFLDVPVEECLRRNALRDRKVPEAAIHELAAALAWRGGVPGRREGQLVVLNPGLSRSSFLLKRVRLHGHRRIKPD